MAVLVARVLLLSTLVYVALAASKQNVTAPKTNMTGNGSAMVIPVEYNAQLEANATAAVESQQCDGTSQLCARLYCQGVYANSCSPAVSPTSSPQVLKAECPIGSSWTECYVAPNFYCNYTGSTVLPLTGPAAIKGAVAAQTVALPGGTGTLNTTGYDVNADYAGTPVNTNRRLLAAVTSTGKDPKTGKSWVVEYDCGAVGIETQTSAAPSKAAAALATAAAAIVAGALAL